MKRYNLISAIFFSFFSKSLYRYVAEAWKGLAYVYILILLAICAVGDTVGSLHQTDLLQQQINPIIEQIPQMTIKQGLVSINMPSPHYIKSKDGDVLAVINTTPNASTEQQQGAWFMLTDHSLIVYSNNDNQKQEVTKIDKTINFKLNKQKAMQTVDHMLNIAKISSYPFSVVWGYIKSMLAALLLGLFALIVAAATCRKITYGSALALSIVALTPAIIFDTVIDAFNLPVHYIFWIQTLISLIYISFAVVAVSKNKEQA